MTMTEIVEESLKADARLRHLTVERDWLSETVHDLVNSGDSLDYEEAFAIMQMERRKK